MGDGELILDKSSKLRETQLLAMIRHPYIVAYEESYVEDGYLYVVMEYAGGGTMERYTDPKFAGGPILPSLDIIKSLFVQLVLAGRSNCVANSIGFHTLAGATGESGARQILLVRNKYAPRAVGYLHAKSIVHRDLKPANVFLNESSLVKLGDLGFHSPCLPRSNSIPLFSVILRYPLPASRFVLPTIYSSSKPQHLTILHSPSLHDLPALPPLQAIPRRRRRGSSSPPHPPMTRAGHRAAGAPTQNAQGYNLLVTRQMVGGIRRDDPARERE